MWYGIGADLIVALHVAYVGFIIVGQLAICLGLTLRWGWVRNPWFRIGHLAAIVTVALEALLGIDCPLTLWEDNLRRLAGQEVTGDSFIGRCLHNMLFYDFEPWVFTVGYVTFALLVIATLFVAPPHWRSLKKGALHTSPRPQAAPHATAHQR